MKETYHIADVTAMILKSFIEVIKETKIDQDTKILCKSISEQPLYPLTHLKVITAILIQVAEQTSTTTFKQDNLITIDYSRLMNDITLKKTQEDENS